MTCPGPAGPNPLDMSSKELLALACTIARVASVLCDVGQVGATGRWPDPDPHARGIAQEDEPYIWDLPEE